MSQDNSREEVINKLISFSEEQNWKSNIIQNDYKDFICYNKEDSFNLVLQQIESFVLPWIRKQLWAKGCFADDFLYSVMQEGRIALWKVMSDDQQHKRIREKFSNYAYGIYKNKTLDSIRNEIREKKKADIQYLDEEVGDAGKKLSDTIPGSIGPEANNEFKETRYLYKELFSIYCSVFMESSAYPPKLLALYYARVLPHIYGSIPDSKGASAKWAFKEMEGKKIDLLRENSESILQAEVSQILVWSIEFLSQLNSLSKIDGYESEYLKDIIYTNVFNVAKIEDWADYMHKKTIVGVMEKMRKNDELFSLAEEYIPKRDKLYQLIKGVR